ncbi:MAG: hypothetical protein ACTSVI_07255 [Promethearchaeota archaeon]
MKDRLKVSDKIDYNLEISRDIKRYLRFLIKELELVQYKEHTDKVLGEIMYIGTTCSDKKTRAYVNRKLREIFVKHPEYNKLL